MQLPRHVDIRTSSGQSVHLGPSLTTPGTAHLKRTPALTVLVQEEMLMTRHQDVERQERKEEAWELKVPGPPGESEPPEGKKEGEDTEQEEDEKKEEGDKEKEEEDKEKNHEQGDDKVKKKEETCEDKDEEDDGVEEGPSKQSDEELKVQREVEGVRRRKLFVSYSGSAVTLDQLQAHFEQYGKVEDVSMLEEEAVVTFTSAVLPHSLAGATHSLQRATMEGGSVPLRLRGGSSRGRGVPPRQQRENTCPFR